MVLEVPVPVDGVLENIVQDAGATVVSNQVIGNIREGATAEPANNRDADTQKSQLTEKTEAAAISSTPSTGTGTSSTTLSVSSSSDSVNR